MPQLFKMDNYLTRALSEYRLQKKREGMVEANQAKMPISIRRGKDDYCSFYLKEVHLDFLMVGYSGEITDEERICLIPMAHIQEIGLV